MGSGAGSGLIRLAAVAAAGVLVALAAALFLHESPWGTTVLWAVGVSGGATALVRSTWSDLPRFVTSWLDAGVFVVGVLFVVALSGFTGGISYSVLRWPRIVALLSAAALLATATGGLALTHRRLADDVRKTTERLAQAQRRALESRLTALSAQINPHFLFNTLNTLAEVVHEDEDQAEDLITDLASMMRYALDSSATRVTLEQELDIVRRLLRIEKARLGDRLAFDVTLDPEAASTRIPGLLVQPLVENAVQHGVAPRTEGGRVTVDVRREGDRVHIEVSDDGPGLPDAVCALLDRPLDGDTHAGGLRNVAERVRLGWPDGAASLNADGPRLVLTVPWESP